MSTTPTLAEILNAAIAQAIVEPHRRSEIRYLLWQALYGATGLAAQGALYQFDERIDAVLEYVPTEE